MTPSPVVPAALCQWHNLSAKSGVSVLKILRRFTLASDHSDMLTSLDNESKCICVLRNSEQQEFATLHLTFAITKCPAFSTPSSSSDSPQTQQGIKTGPKKLGNKRHEFSDTFSYEVGQTLHCFAAFRSHYGDQIPILVCSFLYSTLSVFWRVTDGLGPQRVPGNTASTNETTTPFGHFYPLRDIVLQMNFLLLKITQRPLRLTSDLGIRLLHEILEELCACVATLEAEIERYRGDALNIMLPR